MELKTDLPERSIRIKNNLDAIVKVILGVAKDKIAMIILFGSYAKGNWVIDLVNGYYSDLDILVVWKKTLHYSK